MKIVEFNLRQLNVKIKYGGFELDEDQLFNAYT